MRKKPILMILLALAVLGAAGWLIHREVTPKQPAVCEICGRGITRQVEFRIETTHGTIHACCPSCAMHYVMNHPGEARKELATDFNSGRLVPARSAYYDIGGDVQYCTAHKSPLERTPMGVEERTYDRCLPVLVAFANKDEAEAYREKHGGLVVTYDEALRDVRQQ
jgi:hypothetical protein